MKIELGRFELLYLLEGCARGSHLRQGIWERAVNEFYGKLSEEEREVVYMYAKRDLTGIFSDGHFGSGYFFNFLARFNPANQYVVYVVGDAGGKHHDETVMAYRYNGEYHTHFNRYVAPEFIAGAKRSGGYDKCSLPCVWHEHCARYYANADERKSLYVGSKCDWFINRDTEHGADLKHFEK